MYDDHVQRAHEAEKQLESEAPATLTSTWYECGIVRIQYQGELSKDADQCTRNCSAGRKVELDFDIAQTYPTPSCFELVCGPYQGVDEVEGIVQGDPEDEDSSRHIA